MTTNDFSRTTLGRTNLQVFRLGLSASYRPGTAVIHEAAEQGVNFFFSFGFDTQMRKALRDLFAKGRDRYVLATGAYNYIWTRQDLRRTLEKRLRQFRTDYIDLFLFLGVMKEKEFPGDVREQLLRLREDGRVRFVGISTHDRAFAGRLASEGSLDTLMIRYNAAHRGAEQDIFPYVDRHNVGIVSYTATRWSYLLRPPKGWPAGARMPTPGMAYRFVLSDPHVHLCLTAPRNLRELTENLIALQDGPLNEDELQFMKQFGDAVHNSKRWFM
jgi:aryl-alcohol dehydrogenase-like predicted oxidoreductase